MKNKLKVATVLLIFIVSGCSHYSNIPRQRSFFSAKSNEQPLKERGSLISKNNKDEIAEVKVYSIISKEITEKIAQEDRNNWDYQQINSKDKFAFNHPNSTFIKKSLPLAKSSLPKVFKFHETKKSNAFSNKLSRRKAFPLTLIILGAAIGLIGFIFGIGYLSEKRNDSRPIEPPEAKKVKPVKKKNTLLSTLSIFFWVLSVALIIIPLAFLIILELNFLSFLILIYFLVAAAISASIALVFAIINYFVKKSKEKSQFKNSE
jgi:hypothetical protein